MLIKVREHVSKDIYKALSRREIMVSNYMVQGKVEETYCMAPLLCMGNVGGRYR